MLQSASIRLYQLAVSSPKVSFYAKKARHMNEIDGYTLSIPIDGYSLS